MTAPSLRLRTALAAILLLVLGSTAALAAPGPGVHADVTIQWADPEQATITPGVMTFTDGAGQCTANFVFAAGTDVFLGQAAHCAGLGAANETDGCLSLSLPLKTEVEIDGADHPGTLAYSSWHMMQDVGESDFEACQFNDFALVRLDPRDHDKVNPSIPFWGGPEGVNSAGTDFGDEVYSYGNSSLRLGLRAFSPKSGYSLGTTGEGWNHPVYTLTPGIPGDSGSAFLDADGDALGVLATLAIAPIAGSNGVSDLGRVLDYARTHGGLDVDLVEGTEPFRPGLPL